ncbi:hypothetical protein C1646_699072, partial [Rhizophagus diaphanus]
MLLYYIIHEIRFYSNSFCCCDMILFCFYSRILIYIAGSTGVVEIKFDRFDKLNLLYPIEKFLN